MNGTSKTERQPGCKVIVFRRSGAVIQFGLVPRDDGLGFPIMAFPDPYGIDRALIGFALETLGLHDPKVHERFVARPHEQGWLFYLLEERPVAGAAAPEVTWRELHRARDDVNQEERKALVKAIQYLRDPPT